MTPYFRAPHIFLGLAARFMPGRRVITSNDAERIQVVKRYSNDCSDTVLISSRGGHVVDRQFLESLVRPGPGQENWVSRSNYAARGVVPTGDHEMSLYLSRNYGQPTAYLQRYTLRTDGFVSVNAGYAGGEMHTRLIEFPEPSAEELSRKRQRWRDDVQARRDLPVVDAIQPVQGDQSMPSRPAAGAESAGDAGAWRGIHIGRTRPRRTGRAPPPVFCLQRGGATDPGELILDFNSGGAIENGNALRFLLDDFDLQVSHAALGDWSASSGDQRPHHLAVTWNHGLAKLYFDGRPVAEKRQPNAKRVRLALGDLKFGEDYPPTSTENEPFQGVVDDLLVLKRALTAEEVGPIGGRRCGCGG